MINEDPIIVLGCAAADISEPRPILDLPSFAALDRKRHDRLAARPSSSSTASGCTPRSWRPWVDLFTQAGYDPIAPGWPGEPATVEEARPHPEPVANTSIDDVVEHYARSSTPSRRPIVIGHSFGGLIAEKLLGQGSVPAAVAIDPAQIKGVLPLPPRPAARGPARPGQPGEPAPRRVPDVEQFRFAFGNALSQDESDALFAMDDPGAGPAAVPGGGRELLPPLAGQGRHRQRGPRPAAAHLGCRGPHRARTCHQVHPEAVPALVRRHRAHAVPRPRPLPDHRQRVVRGRRSRPVRLRAHGA